MRKLFIIGCPRSGTTLLQQVLTRHPEVVIPPETAFFNKLLSRWPGRYRRQLAQINSDLEISLTHARRPGTARETVALYNEMATAYATRTGRPDALWFGEKTPNHLRHARTIASLFTDARFVLIYRDGRDVAISLSGVPWAPAHPVVNFGIWLQAIRRQNDLLDRPPVPMLPIRYEDLVESPEVEVRRIVEFLELEFRGELLVPGDGPQGIPDWERDWKGYAHEPIRRDRVGIWKSELTSDQLERIERWGGEALSRLGYEVSTPDIRRSGPGVVTYLHRALWRARAAAALLAGRR